MLKGTVLRKTLNVKDWHLANSDLKREKDNIIIEKVIELSETEFDSLSQNFFDNRAYITENSKNMWKDEKGWHMIAISCRIRDLIICIESEGYDYNKYCSIFTKYDFEWIYRRRCNCLDCDKKADCIHKDAFRRMPREIGGLALCPKLKENTDPKREKAR